MCIVEQPERTAMNEVRRVMRLVEPLLSQAGFPIGVWSYELLSSRNDAKMHRIIVKLSAPDYPTLAVKCVFRPLDSERFVKTAMRQKEVNHSSGDGPAVHAVDPEAQIILMDFVSGRTLYELCDGQPVASHAHHLRRVGAWLDTFHRGGKPEPRQFRPSFTLKHLQSVKDDFQNNHIHVANRSAFLALLEHTLESAPQPDACHTVAAVNHGDLNLRNLLIDGDRVTALDFGVRGLLPVAHDLARLFCHYGALCVSPSHASDSPLPGVNLVPFFDGYRLTTEDDASIAFFCKARLIRDWQKIPQKAVKRSIAQQIRFRGIQKLADRILN